MRIDLTTTKNVKLKTAGKYTGEDIEVVPNLQSKLINPTELDQVLNVDDGFSGMKQVKVNAIPSDYVGSGVTRKGETAYTPTTTDQEIASGQYLSGKQVIKGDSNLVAENIAKDKTIFGITGTHEGGITPEGTMLIQQNGVYDVTTIAEVDVQVSTPTTPVEPPVLTIKNITENGTYNAEDDGADGYSMVTVNVAGSGSGEGITDGLARYIAGDDALTELIPSDFGDITELKAGAFFRNTSVKTPTVTKITLPNKVTTLGNNCFYGNTALQEISADGVTSMGSYCFYNCTALQSLNLENITTVGDYCFSGCAGLKHIDISFIAKKSKMPTYLLNNCTGIESIITGEYEENEYIYPNTYSLYGLKSLRDIDNGKNVLKIISGVYGTTLQYQCGYLSANLDNPVIDVEDYASKWATSGTGVKSSFYGAKVKNYTFINATSIWQGGNGYVSSMFQSATVINMYMPKVTRLDNVYHLGGITNLERLYLPVLTSLGGTSIPTNCNRVIMGDTAPTLTTAVSTSNTKSKFYISYTKTDHYTSATNWTALFTNDGTEETRMFVHGEFTNGDTLPTQIGTTQVYNVTWYEDDDFTTQASGTATETKEYYGKITAVV